MVEERGNLQDVENLRRNLLEVHSKMRYLVKENLTNVLAPLLKTPAPKNTTTGSLFYWTHDMSWRLRISRLFIRVKM